MYLWGEAVPNWLAAIGTVGAVVVALWIALRDMHRQGTADRKAEEAEAERARKAVEIEESRRRAQAELVIGWALVSTTEHPDYVAGVGGFYANYSGQPVFEARIEVLGEKTGRRFHEVRLPVLPPSDEATMIDLGLADEYTDELPRIVMSFRDVAGRRWRRYPDGRLDPLDEKWRPTPDGSGQE
jgi:hypothetical protein